MRDFLASMFSGGSCYVCRGAARAHLCQACLDDLPYRDSPACPRCALPSPGGAVCGRCLAHPPHYDATVAALDYAFPADALVQALKFRGELALAALFSTLLLKKLSTPEKVDLVAPVPLSNGRLRVRGYNQAVEIARPIARALHARRDYLVLVKSRETKPQAELPYAERVKNVRGAFQCVRAIPDASVAIVDDVMTTGATLDEIAATLKRAGAARVVNWVVARTPPPD
jgi:ComF family protein